MLSWLLALGALVLVLFLAFTLSHNFIFLEWTLLFNNSINLSLVFCVDPVSAIFALTVSVIATAVWVFSYEYISSDNNNARFHAILFLFVASMVLLIFSANLLTALVGWDGLGVSSYLLVLYYNSNTSHVSGFITLISNRFGDAFILASVATVWASGYFSFFSYSYLPLDGGLLSLLLTLAACTNSAQLPFSAWLPAAIAAPTPVSSLVHSSTLVTAGVYLLLRHLTSNFNNFLEEKSSYFLLLVSVLTMTLAGLAALCENDLNKIVALSTLSQLGLMMLSVSLQLSSLAFFHLISHAFFNALMFLSAGSLIHNIDGYQDLRISGSLSNSAPITSTSFVCAAISLCGAPFTSAFFSNEVILEAVLLSQNEAWGYSGLALGFILTLIYTFRLLALTMASTPCQSPLAYKSDESSPIIASLVLLTLPALTGGYILTKALFCTFPLPSSSLTLNLCVLFTLLGTALVSLFFTIYSKSTNLGFVNSSFSSLMWLPQLSNFLNSLTINCSNSTLLKWEAPVIPFLFLLWTQNFSAALSVLSNTASLIPNILSLMAITALLLCTL